MITKRRLCVLAIATAALIVASACGGSSGSSSAKNTTGATGSGASGKKFKVALSLSFTGNAWQSEAANLIKAEAATPPYDQLVTLHQDIAGADVTKQLQTLNSEIDAGYDAIIVYPISPSSLNSAIERACAKKIVVYAYDSLVTAPCAYNVHVDQYEQGSTDMEWLAQQLHGKGNVVIISGVPGTTVDTDRLKGAHDVLAKHPDLHLVATANGQWSAPIAKTQYAAVAASHPKVDGVYAEGGCGGIAQYLLEQNKPLIPCAGEMTVLHHWFMLSPDFGGVSWNSRGAGSPVYSGELALINSVKVLQGKSVPHDIILPLPAWTTADLKAAGAKAVGDNPAQGALVPPKGSVPETFLIDYWSPLVEQGLKAAIDGTPTKISDAMECSAVPGCKTQDKAVIDDNHSGGN